MPRLFNPVDTKNNRIKLKSGFAYSPVERKLWSVLRAKKLKGLKFRRQHGIGPYIVDFYCHELKLIIEVDGSSHDETEQYDSNREEFLMAQGFNILRFTNKDVLHNLAGVIEKIEIVSEETSPQPSPTRIGS